MYKVTRIAVRAIIKKDNLLLTLKRIKNGEIYWVFPGGGVDEGENNEQALMRECKEELGVDVKVGEFVYEYFFNNPEFSKQKEFFYQCEIIGGELGTGDGPEFQADSKYEGMRDIEWLNLSKLERFDLMPNEIKKLL